MHLKSGEDLLCPVVGDMYISYGRKVDGDDIEHARAVIAPGLLPTTDVDINQYHRTTAHTHPRLLRESARQQGVKLKPGVKLLPCVGCSTAKGFSAPVKKTNECRSDKKHGRVFVDLSGEKTVLSMGGKQYGMIFCNDATRMSKEDFMKHKSVAPEALDSTCLTPRTSSLPKSSILMTCLS